MLFCVLRNPLVFKRDLFYGLLVFTTTTSVAQRLMPGPEGLHIGGRRGELLMTPPDTLVISSQRPGAACHSWFVSRQEGVALQRPPPTGNPRQLRLDASGADSEGVSRDPR
ncbi:unnamed protein product [Arctogadus glacialis]